MHNRQSNYLGMFVGILFNLCSWCLCSWCHFLLGPECLVHAISDPLVYPAVKAQNNVEAPNTLLHLGHEAHSEPLAQHFLRNLQVVFINLIREVLAVELPDEVVLVVAALFHAGPLL